MCVFKESCYFIYITKPRKVNMNIINLIGYASGSAANDEGCCLGPQYLLENRKIFTDYQLEPNWRFMEYLHSQHHGLDVIPDIGASLGLLVQDVMSLASEPSPFAVIGGDHSMAIATWHAMMQYYHATGPIGLIWVDAHMDSNTPNPPLVKTRMVCQCRIYWDYGIIQPYKKMFLKLF